jgi:hypothetical protein
MEEFHFFAYRISRWEGKKKSRKEKEAGRRENGNFMKLQEKTYIRTCGWGAQPSAARGVLKFWRSLTPAVQGII